MKRLIVAALALWLSVPALADQSSYQIPLTGPKAFGGSGGVADQISHGFLAAVGCSSGGSTPANGPSSAPILGQCWLNTTSSPNQMQIYDGANWPNFFLLDTTNHRVIPNTQQIILEPPTATFTAPDGRQLQIIGDNTSTHPQIGFRAWGGNDNESDIDFFLTTGSSPTTQGALFNGYAINRLRSFGSDGAAFRSVAQIEVDADTDFSSGSSPGRISFYTTLTGTTSLVERERIDNGGHIVIQPPTAAFAAPGSEQLQIVGDNTSQHPTIGMYAWGGNDNQGNLNAYYTAGGSPTTQSAVSSGNVLGRLRYFGSDGSAFQQSANIEFDADATFTAGSAPGRVLISTSASGSTAPSTRLKIDSSGTATFSGGSTSSNASVVNVTPPASSLALGVNITQSADGSPSASNYSGASGTGYTLNNITISSDDMVILASGPAIGIGYGWAINHSFGGSNMRGARSAVGISANLTATSSASNQDREYVGSTTYVTSTVNDTGTNTGAGAAGSIFAENPFVCLCSSSATNYFSMNGAEVDVSNRAGTVKYKFGWRVVLDGADNGQGVTIDAAYTVGGGGLHGGWKNAYALDDLGANTSPVGTTGCVLCTVFAGGPYTITTGIDISAYTITGNALRTPNFQLTGAGALTASSFAITGGSAGVSCAANTVSLTTLVVSSGIVTHC